MDSSAAAVAALAFATLAEAAPDTACGRRYLGAAINTLRALASDAYLAKPPATAAAAADAGGGAVLLHATANRPQDVGLDMGIVWGDYYLLEAVEACKRMPACANAV
jgi:unsaturated chondroitin disaccharide hydrolase